MKAIIAKTTIIMILIMEFKELESKEKRTKPIRFNAKNIFFIFLI